MSPSEPAARAGRGPAENAGGLRGANSEALPAGDPEALPAENGERVPAGSVRSLERAFELLEHLADADGEMALSELTEVSGLPMPTIYRLMRTLVAQGYVRRQPSRRYALGPRLIRLGESAGRAMGSRARPYLAELVEAVGETANMALLEGDEVVYVAQMPSRHQVRMFTEVGRRVQPHCTGVGKALLAMLDENASKEILTRIGMPAQTPHTITDPATMLTELEQIRRQGYAIDDGEQELGVRCVAVPLIGAPTLSAISVSGPEGRLDPETVRRIVPVMQQAAERLVKSLSGS